MMKKRAMETLKHVARTSRSRRYRLAVGDMVEHEGAYGLVVDVTSKNVVVGYRTLAGVKEVTYPIVRVRVVHV